MAHIAIIGANIGGLPAAYEIQDILKKDTPGDHEVTVASNTADFSFVPSNPWVAVGWRKREDTGFTVHEHNNEGEVIKEHELEFNFSMMLPAFLGIDAVNKVGEDLVNPRGFVKVDNHQRNPKWNNIYSVGVCIAIPPVEATPVPTGTPKTGYMIESMTAATAHNISNDIKGNIPEKVGTWNAFCLADMGDTGVAFIAAPQIPPRNITWAKKGKWVHLSKVAFEKYFIFNMKRGSHDPLFQKLALKVMGLNRLKD